MQLFYVFGYNRKDNVRLHTGTVVLVGSTHMDKQIIYDPIYELTGP